MFKLMSKKILTILLLKFFFVWRYDTLNLTLIMIKFELENLMMCVKYIDRMSNSINPDHTASLGQDI